MLSDNIEISPNIARKINNNMLKLIVNIHVKLKKKVDFIVLIDKIYLVTHIYDSILHKMIVNKANDL